MAKTVVVFHSGYGHTERVASFVAEGAKAELVVIDADGNVSYDPLTHFLDVFSGVDSKAARQSRADELAEMPLNERLQRRIIDGEKKGLEADLDEAMANGMKALQIINDAKVGSSSCCYQSKNLMGRIFTMVFINCICCRICLQRTLLIWLN